MTWRPIWPRSGTDDCADSWADLERQEIATIAEALSRDERWMAGMLARLEADRRSALTEPEMTPPSFEGHPGGADRLSAGSVLPLRSTDSQLNEHSAVPPVVRAAVAAVPTGFSAGRPRPGCVVLLAMSTALIATALPAALVWGAGPEQRVFGAAALGTLFLAATALVAMAVGDRSPRGAFEVVRQWWESDATVRLGAGLGAAGIAVSTVGVFGVSYGLSMGSAEVGLGAATFVVGVYFAWGSDPFAEGASCSKVTAERRRRRMAAALTAVSTLSWVSALRFTPGLDTSPAKLGMLGAAILATLACSTGFVGIAFHGKGFGTKGWGPRRLRRRLVKTGVTLCGGACLVYAGTHLYVAIALSPPVSMRAALIAAAAALAITAYVSIRNSPEEFIRLMEVAVRWGFYVPQARYGGQPPEPSPEVDLHDSGQRHEVG